MLNSIKLWIQSKYFEWNSEPQLEPDTLPVRPENCSKQIIKLSVNTIRLIVIVSILLVIIVLDLLCVNIKRLERLKRASGPVQAKHRLHYINIVEAHHNLGNTN